MAVGLSAAVTPKPFRSFPLLKPAPIFHPLLHLPKITTYGARRKKSFAVCFVVDEEQKQSAPTQIVEQGFEEVRDRQILIPARLSEKLARKRSERFTYLVAAVMSSFGITSMSVMAVYYRFWWQMEVGMEFWARWAHRALWHASLWHMHESHHRPREGPFELNDVFAITNAVPAIALLSYGFFNKGLVPGLCFGAGLGITMFGMAYMFVHDGLVHKRFPVGPIANVPYFRKVAAAHQLHHSEKFNGVPYGLFLGPKEVEDVGGHEELEKEINRRIKSSKGS
ncbi:hypothetical protein V6Z11_A09G209900 [Gossypium hirsutum]|uniref:beta-carotene 3-hydroxylase n=3 Tax=Gossypium TaxID=3633 RepID=A0ABM2YQW2_GOSHI|nr:beta-carotene hydroxylase 2, chloroplastic isoform X2 [Gossypium hirsutum]XP_052875249.1 beta-carotene hydroxylase 2, chloroplastic-like isoform X2 [Gossypium arboreum]TYH03385.1 hypothetical protein ES288_A09G215300v1 [Gossypium darwinii]TYI11494.1 hypothetical protein ES332_A09G211200v1 [Gossypium tomentosum]